MKNLRGKDLHNGALVAIDYQTGQIIAYVGSVDYYSTACSPAFQPQFDVAGSGWRQPGSAFKPFNYLTGIDDKVMTAASMFLDAATDFGGGYSPSDADNLERGPVRVRNAPPVLAEHPLGQGHGRQHARAPLRPGEGLRDDVPDRHAIGRAGAGPRRPGGSAGRPDDGLRDARQRRQAHSRTRRSSRSRTRPEPMSASRSPRPRAPRRPRPRRPTSSPTSSPATRTRR